MRCMLWTTRVSEGYAYEHGWDEERLRLRGLEVALDSGRASTSFAWESSQGLGAWRSGQEEGLSLAGSRSRSRPTGSS